MQSSPYPQKKEEERERERERKREKEVINKFFSISLLFL